MRDLYTRLTLADVHGEVYRNIVSLRESQDLFDDLSDRPGDWQLAQRIEADARPPPYRSSTPIIHRPFEDAAWFNAIQWPFTHWQRSRFSDGTFGAWYGADRIETTVHETTYHWYRGLLTDAGFERESVVAERKVYVVACNAALLDFRTLVRDFPELAHRHDYGHAQTVGARLHREGHPGLIVPSVRAPAGDNYVVFNPAVLSNPRVSCMLTYRLDNGRIRVERQKGKAWLKLETEALS